MILKELGEVVWRFYQNGKAKADKQNLRQEDITQMCRISAANNIRQQYVFGQKIYPGRRIQPVPSEHEYYFWSPLLQVKEFSLPDADNFRMRRADMGEFDLYRLPQNSHFTNIWMINAECAGLKTNTLTLLQNGEEKFYAGKDKFSFFIFGAVVGRGINTYNVPSCIKLLQIETTYEGPDVDISMDIAFDAAQEVLNLCIEVGQFNGSDKIRLAEELKKREDIK